MRRSGLSLIEILVVIAIIVALMGLILPAVMGVWPPAELAEVRNEIARFERYVEEQQQEIGMVPPSLLKLCGNESDYGNAPLDIESRRYLRKRFPNIVWANMDWNGDGQPDGTTTLDGGQCLAFVLAGPAGRGFSANPTNPTDFGGGRLPMAHLDGRRLRAGPGGFHYYVDRYGTPYLYFSCHNKRNGYVVGDCPQLGSGPYQRARGQFVNPESFQIIAAGRDRQFGTGSLLDQLPREALDNVTSFSKGTLNAHR